MVKRLLAWFLFETELRVSNEWLAHHRAKAFSLRQAAPIQSNLVSERLALQKRDDND